MPRMRAEKGGRDGWSDWLRPIGRSYRMACCDCGLVHDLEFRVVASQPEFRARRNNRSTARLRRGARRFKV